MGSPPREPSLHFSLNLTPTSKSPGWTGSNMRNIPSNLVTEISPGRSPRLPNNNFMRGDAMKWQPTIKYPAEPPKERSKLFNMMYAIFYGSNSIADGYAITMLSPLGEKWIRFHFNQTEYLSFFYGLTNLVYCIGFIIGILYAHWGPAKVQRTRSL
jgi:hypothetical protein